MPHSVLVRLGAVTAAAGLLAGCGTDQQSQDELLVGPSPVAATPATAPAAATTPRGTVLPLPGNATATTVDQSTRQLAIAIADPPQLLLYALDTPTGPPRAIPLPGPAEQLTPVDGGLLAAIPTKQQIVRITLPSGQTSTVGVEGDPAGVTAYRGKTLVALRARKAVGIVGEQRLQQLITGGLFSADQILTVGDHVIVLDRVRTAVFDINVDAGTVGAGLRAGQGAGTAVVDRYGRVLVTDTRGGALLAFSVNPLLLRQLYPVPGAPYGLAYDPTRDLAWVTLTERNEVVGYNMAGEQPEEKYRIPTVHQPNTVAVDPATGRVIVASADGAGVQLVQP